MTDHDTPEVADNRKDAMTKTLRDLLTQALDLLPDDAPEPVTTFDFQDGIGPVPAHRHTNPDGTEGGWVANTARVSGNAWVYGARFDRGHVY